MASQSYLVVHMRTMSVDTGGTEERCGWNWVEGTRAASVTRHKFGSCLPVDGIVFESMNMGKISRREVK